MEILKIIFQIILSIVIVNLGFKIILNSHKDIPIIDLLTNWFHAEFVSRSVFNGRSQKDIKTVLTDDENIKKIIKILEESEYQYQIRMSKFYVDVWSDYYKKLKAQEDKKNEI